MPVVPPVWRMVRSSSGRIRTAGGAAGRRAEAAITSSPMAAAAPVVSGPGPRVRTVGTSTSGINSAAAANRSASTSRMVVSTLVAISARIGALMPSYRFTIRAPASQAAYRALSASAVLPAMRVTVVPRVAPRASSSWARRYVAAANSPAVITAPSAVVMARRSGSAERERRIRAGALTNSASVMATSSSWVATMAAD